MKHFFRIDKEKKQIVLIEKDGDYEKEFKKPKHQKDILFNLSKITNISGNYETRLFGNAIIEWDAFRIKNFGDKDYEISPKAHFQFRAADEVIEPNHYYIDNNLGDETDDISLYIDCYLGTDFLKEFSDRVSNKEVETLQVSLDISTTNNIFRSLDMGGNTHIVILNNIQNLKNENGEFEALPKEFNLENNIARGVKISWTRSYNLKNII